MADLTRAELIVRFNAATLSLAARPRELRGPFEIDHEDLERRAALLRALDAKEKEG